MKKIIIIFLIFITQSASAAQFIRILKQSSVIAYKDPSTQSKMLNVFKLNDEVEVVGENDGWLKVKLFLNQDLFIYGWVFKNSPNVVMVTKKIQPNVQKDTPIDHDAEEESSEKIGRSIGKRNMDAEDEEMDEDPKHFVRTFFGSVYNLYKYGTFQYRFGLAYEVPLSQRFKLGFPISYMMGGSFKSGQGGVEIMRSQFFKSFSITPHIGASFEHLYGNGKSFNAYNLEMGVAIDYSISKHFTVGIEPFTAEAMVFNTTSSLNKVARNIRGESFILLRGKW